jgi:hypothetical protein
VPSATGGLKIGEVMEFLFIFPRNETKKKTPTKPTAFLIISFL